MSEPNEEPNLVVLSHTEVNPILVEELERFLEQAKRGEIRDALILALGGNSFDIYRRVWTVDGMQRAMILATSLELVRVELLDHIRSHSVAVGESP